MLREAGRLGGWEWTLGSVGMSDERSSDESCDGKLGLNIFLESNEKAPLVESCIRGSLVQVNPREHLD